MASWITAHWMFPLQCEIVEVSSSATSPLLRSACCNIWRPERLFSRSRKQEFGGRAEQSWVEEPEEPGPLALWPAAWWTSAQGAASVKDEGKWVNIDAQCSRSSSSLSSSAVRCGAGRRRSVGSLASFQWLSGVTAPQRHLDSCRPAALSGT